MIKLFFVLIILFVFPTQVSAYVTSEVRVDSNVERSSENTNSATSTTDVVIEVNGEKKEFHSDGNEDINWISEDGKSSVKINSNSDIKPTNSEKSPSPTLKPTVVEERVKKEIEETKKDIFSLLKKEVERIKSLIFDSLKDLPLL